ISCRLISGTSHSLLDGVLAPVAVRRGCVARRTVSPGPVVAAQAADLHALARGRCVDVLAATDVDADVVSTPVAGRVVPEDQVPRAEVATADGLPARALLVRDAGQVHPELLHDVLGEARAVEPRRGRAAPHVRRADELLREVHQRLVPAAATSGRGVASHREGRATTRLAGAERRLALDLAPDVTERVRADGGVRGGRIERPLAERPRRHRDTLGGGVLLGGDALGALTRLLDPRQGAVLLPFRLDLRHPDSPPTPGTRAPGGVRPCTSWPPGGRRSPAAPWPARAATAEHPQPSHPAGQTCSCSTRLRPSRST